MEIEIRSPLTQMEWDAYYDLRFRVLRAPWNQQKGSERDNQEDEAEHFAVFNKQLIIGVGRLDQLNESTCQVRFMAVDPLFQGKSIGKSLMEFILIHSQKKQEKKSSTQVGLRAQVHNLEIWKTTKKKLKPFLGILYLN